MVTPRPAPEGRSADEEPAHVDRSPFARYAQRFGRSIAAVPGLLREGGDPVQVASALGMPAAAVRGPATFFPDFSVPRAPRHVRVCGAAACCAASGGRHVAEVTSGLGTAVGTRSADGAVSVQEVRCLGYCYGGPAALDGDEPCAGPDLSAQLQGLAPRRDPVAEVHSHSRTPVVTAGLVGAAEPWGIWTAALAAGSPDAVLADVAAARLTGRGGAGFGTARKWQAARAHPGPRAVVANGDEGDPGSYVDRLLMEQDPHRLLEGLALACFAVGAATGIVFVRSEYPRAAVRLRAAVAEAEDAGHLGLDVHGSGVDVQVRVAVGAGSYVSGEETALLNGLEGLRGVVRPRPPYPVERGLFGLPTVVNNVETLAAVPWIVEHGGAAYAAMGTPEESGTVVVCLSERFVRPGAYEVEPGISLRRVVEDFGGGLRGGAVLRAVQVGGPLGGFLSPEDLDTPLGEASLAARGAALGHAGIVAFDERLTGEQVLSNLWAFAEAESCGQCSPCRVGSRLGRLLAGEPVGTQDRSRRSHLLDTMSEASLCAFGRRVPAAVRSLARVYGLQEWT
jgi:bidirectional [NiFe] hydrogenase diaphorase subunit